MISFRFHLVSLVAVFLALGLGVLTGTTVINRGIVRQLQERTDDLSGQLDGLREEFAEAQAEREVWSAFAEEVASPVLAGRLIETPVVLIKQEGTDEASIAGVRRFLEEAGAEVIGPLSVSGRMVLESATDREELASIVGLDASEEPDSLSAQAAALLAQRLAFAPDGDQSLERLLEAGFLVSEGAGLGPEVLRGLGGPDQAAVVLAGGPAITRLQPERFLVPLVDALSDDGVPVVAGEPANGAEQEQPFVALLREGDVAMRIATQDNVDQMPGQIGLVLALEDLIEGVPGHYGVKDGASRVIPELP